MDKNSFIGLLLIGLILIGYTYINRPTAEEQQAFKRKQDSTIVAQQQLKEDQKYIDSVSTAVQKQNLQLPEVIADSVKQVLAQQNLGSFAQAAFGEEKLIRLENEKLIVWISNKGGKVVKTQLKDYKKFDGEPLILLDSDSTEFGFQFYNSNNRSINTNDLFFAINGSDFSISGKTQKSLSLKLIIEEGKYIEYVYSLSGNSYVIDFDFNVVGMQNIVAGNTTRFDLTWRTVLKQQEKNFKDEKAISTIYYSFLDEELDYLSETKSDEEAIKAEVKWISFKQKFFSTVLIAKEHFEDANLSIIQQDEDKEDFLKITEATLSIPYRHAPVENFGMQFYFGPNHYQTLKKLKLKLERQIPLGWGIFGWINRLVIIPLFNFFDNYFASYGIIILILTIIIKVALMPFTYKSYLSQAKMKVLKPEVEEIQAKYKGGDQMKQQQETMALYKKAGVNPLGGCIPMLFQMPILIAMFRFFPSSIELRQQAFLWAHDLSTYDSILDLPFTIPFYGDHVSLFTLLMTVSTIMYTMVNQQMAMTSNPQMKWMMYLMPIMFLGFFNNYSAGLSYYYFLANVITFLQTFIFKGLINEDEIHRKVQERKKNAKPIKKSKFQERLEKMAKEKGYKTPKK